MFLLVIIFIKFRHLLLAANRSFHCYSKKGQCISALPFYIHYGAGDGNRTHATSLEGWSSTIELHPHIWCRGPDLNRYGRNSRQILSLLRLPIPPPRHQLLKMVGKTGFEPATPWSQAKYSTKLSYFPTSDMDVLGSTLPQDVASLVDLQNGVP